jgi:hypothetical protein
VADDACFGGAQAQGQSDAARTVLAEMDAVIAWARLLGLIEPQCPRTGSRRQRRPMERIIAEIRTLREEKRLLLESGTIVDATFSAAPPSSKNAEKAREPELHQTRKGKQ